MNDQQRETLRELFDAPSIYCLQKESANELFYARVHMSHNIPQKANLFLVFTNYLFVKDALEIIQKSTDELIIQRYAEPIDAMKFLVECREMDFLTINPKLSSDEDSLDLKYSNLLHKFHLVVALLKIKNQIPF